MKIQWYPGHMTKAKRAMSEDIKIIDIVIEMLDARAPMATSNPDIEKLAIGKSRIIILNKADMADERVNKEWLNYYESKGCLCMTLDSRKNQFTKKLMPHIVIAAKEKRERDLKRGIKNRPVRTMITGIPNVGKSTLINSIVGKAMAKTGNKPGVTKGNQWIRINKSVELLDTPGILWPKFEDEHTGEMIAFIGSINDLIVDTTELAAAFIEWCFKNDESLLKERYDIAGNTVEEVLKEIAIKRSCLKKGNEYDYEKAAAILIQDFREGKLGKISLEKPKEVE